ncbi:hypothetical protein CHS0354_017905, partial [Potamilus streckersoni]
MTNSMITMMLGHVKGLHHPDLVMQEPAFTSEELMNGLKYARPGHGFVPNFNLTKKTEVNGHNEHPLFTYIK